MKTLAQVFEENNLIPDRDIISEKIMKSQSKEKTMHKKQTAVKLILDKFNLLSDNDFQSWILNHYDELIEMEQAQIEDVAMYHKDSAVEIDCIRSYMKKKYHMQDEE